MFALKASPTFPDISPACLINSSKFPYSFIHLTAVFSPTLGTDGKLSDGSPRNAAKSGYCAGVNSYLSNTACGVIRAMSETPLRAYKTVIESFTN